MEKLDLTVSEKSQLIDNYKSELRKLEFQIEAAKAAISFLEAGVAKAPQVSVLDGENTDVPETTTKKRGPRPKEQAVATETPAPSPVQKEEKAVTKGKAGKKAGTKKAAAPQEAPVEEAGAPETSPAETSAEEVAAAPGKGKGKGKRKAVKAADTTAVEESPATESKPAKTKKEKSEKKEKPKTAKASKEKNPESEGDRKKPGPKATLSFWDEFILEKLRAVGEGSLSSSDLLEAMRSERDAKDLQLGNVQLSQLLNRSLQKLVHKMKLVASQQLAGRNFTYWAK